MLRILETCFVCGSSGRALHLERKPLYLVESVFSSARVNLASWTEAACLLSDASSDDGTSWLQLAP